MTATALPDVLRKAADIIGERGWTRATDMDPETGGVCANGALRIALGQEVYRSETGAARIRAILDWTPQQYAVFGAAMSAAHRATASRVEIDGSVQALVFGDMPPLVLFNDKIAKDGSEVQALFRETADWIESHPLAELARVEDTPVPFELTPKAQQALGNENLVNA